MSVKCFETLHLDLLVRQPSAPIDLSDMVEETIVSDKSAETFKPRFPSLKARLRAAGIHVSISVAIFLVFLSLILTKWYPPPYFLTDGGWQGIRIMLFVDIVLGPVMTLLIFNPAKTRRAILFDLSMIALVQSAALVWGVYAVYSQHPAAIVHWENRLISVTKEQLWEKDIDAGTLRKFSDEHPPIIVAQYPKTTEGKKALLRRANQGFAPILQQEIYRSPEEDLDAFFEFHLDAKKVVAENPGVQEELDILLQDTGLALDDLRLMYFKGRYKDSILVFRQDGAVLGALHNIQN